MRDVHLYPDGACLENGLPSAKGGWAYLVVIGGEVEERHMGRLRVGRQTNNRAEMEAFLQTLLWIESNKTDDFIHIHCDSEIVVNGVNGSSKRNANRDIWDQIELMCERLIGRFDIQYCESKSEFNFETDELAKQAANSLLIAPTVVSI